MSLNPMGYDSSLQPSSTFGLGIGSDLSVFDNDPQNFQLSLDVHDFQPEELSIKHINDSIVIHGKFLWFSSVDELVQQSMSNLGKHDERSDSHGFLKREFTRRLTLPSSLDDGQVFGHFGNNQLTILGPEAAERAERCGSHCVPIEHEYRPWFAQISKYFENCSINLLSTKICYNCSNLNLNSTINSNSDYFMLSSSIAINYEF